MYTTLFLVQAAMQLALFAWVWRLWRGTGVAAAAVLLVPQFGLVYDNLIVALGGFIGLGPTLEALSWPRFWIHWLCGAWLIIASGSILRLAGLPWARQRGAMVAFCALTVSLMALELPQFWTTTLHPVCELDLLRYSVQVPANALCSPDQQPVPGHGPPIAPVVTCLVVIASGGVLLWRRRFPWMLLGGVLMLVSAMPPFSALKLDNFGEVLIAGGCIAAVARFAGGNRAAPAHAA